MLEETPGCSFCRAGQCHREWAERDTSPVSVRGRYQWPYTADRSPLAIMQMWMWHGSLSRAWCDGRGIHRHLAAAAATVSISIVHTSSHLRPLPHPSPPSPSLSLFLPPPPPCLHPPLPPPPPPPPPRLPASSLSCSRCGVAIATEKCGNTSVLQNAGERERRERERGGERERERDGGRVEEGKDGRQT